MGLSVEPIDQPQFQAWQVTPQSATDVMLAVGTAAALGYQASVAPFVQPNAVDPNTGGPVLIWTVTLSKPGTKDMVAYYSDWLVLDGHGVVVMTNHEFIAKYTVDVPLQWDDSLAPDVEALPSDQVTLTFAQPTSPNGPFTYTVTANDATDNSSAELNVIDQTVADGRVTLKGDGLITGHLYLFTVAVSTQYNTEPVTSAPSLSITAVL